MRKHILIALPAALALLAGSANAQTAINEAQTVNPNRVNVESGQKPIALPIPKGKETRPVGMQAIGVSAKVEQSFSIETLTAYFHKRNLPMNMGPAASIRVEKVEFMTDHDLAARLNGESTGIGADERVVLVTLRGIFVFSGPPGSHLARSERAYAVFDARSGNLLMSGTVGEGAQ